MDGGAAIAARRIHYSLLQGKIDSNFVYLDDSGNSLNQFAFPDNQSCYYSSNSQVFKFLRSIAYKLYYLQYCYYLVGRPKQYELFSLPGHLLNTKADDIISGQDILHLHWIAEKIDYNSFFSTIPDSFPIVWTLHDMNPFTGGCHYSWECNRYKKSCGNCPQLNNSSLLDASVKNFRKKREALKKKNLHIVADSYWLQKESQNSPIFEFANSFQTIHYGIDTSIFFPNNKRKAKNDLNLDPQKTVISFGAINISNLRKGGQILLNALKYFQDQEDLLFLSFGTTNIPFSAGKLEHHNFNYVKDERLLATIYSASDIFVIPSIYEAFGQTCLEAMSCSTPVIGSETGGIPDMIIDKITGLLVKPNDTKSLVTAIDFLIKNQDIRKLMGERAHERVMRNFNFQTQANKYKKLYKKILELPGA